jgi:3-hydroxyisobutyrate dehydrogenase-like beta-hydroxyacid dehydrogenase
VTTGPGSVAVGIVGPGAMGVALGRCFAAGGHPVLMTAAGRSESTARRLAEADIADAGSLDAVVAGAAVVVSVVPPAQARGVADELAASASRTSATPLVVEANAVSPGTVTDVAARLGLDLVDAAISGPPPSPDADRPTRVFLSGPRSAEVASRGVPGVRWIEIDGEIGAASATKMCTASVRKGHQALLVHALLTAERHGVVDAVLADLQLDYPRDDVRQAAVAATKAWRFADEMEEIAATQGEVGLTPALFAAMAEVYRRLATSPLGTTRPEDLPATPDVADLRST